ncbi:MAG: guanylate kinase [Lachnospiraceae bacterium]|nr:guanylate kinase [Lachnospiraceae bacterium]
MGRIFYLIGKSACGKDSIFSRLMMKKPQLKNYIMYTTRPLRDGEAEGDPYHFVTPDMLKKYEDQGKLVESRTYHTIKGPWIYATVDDGQIELEKYSYLVSGGTVESYVGVRDYFGADKVIPIYIEVEDGERLIRAIRREQHQEVPKYKEMCRRFIADSEDFSEEKIAEAGITKQFVNDDIDSCVDRISEFIDKEVIS